MADLHTLLQAITQQTRTIESLTAIITQASKDIADMEEKIRDCETSIALQQQASERIREDIREIKSELKQSKTFERIITGIAALIGTGIGAAVSAIALLSK
jgi:DNA repair exonuclease SbcCD ATPase subunit